MDDLATLIRSGDVARVRALLDQSPEVLQSDIVGAPSALLLAAYYGHPPVVEAIRSYVPKLSMHEAAAVGDLHQLETALAENPSGHQEFSSDGFTPLCFAAYFNHPLAAERLLAAGADPNVCSQNPLGVAPLHSALAGGHKELARTLIEAGSDLSLASAAGWTPAHYVAYSGDVETARLLIDRNAPLDLENGEGKTPADLAREHGHTALGERFERLLA